MTSLTKNQKLPYPSSDQEGARGGSATQALAEAVDARLIVVDAAWVAEQQHETKILTLNNPITALAANTYSNVLMETAQKAVGGNPSTQQIMAFDPGWYHVFINLGVACSGTINAGTRRRVEARLREPVQWDRFGTYRETYVHEEYQTTAGETNHGLTFVTKLGSGTTMELWYWHQNTGSTLTIVTANTVVSATRICGDV